MTSTELQDLVDQAQPGDTITLAGEIVLDRAIVLPPRAIRLVGSSR